MTRAECRARRAVDSVPSAFLVGVQVPSGLTIDGVAAALCHRLTERGLVVADEVGVHRQTLRGGHARN